MRNPDIESSCFANYLDNLIREWYVFLLKWFEMYISTPNQYWGCIILTCLFSDVLINGGIQLCPFILSDSLLQSQSISSLGLYNLTMTSRLLAPLFTELKLKLIYHMISSIYIYIHLSATLLHNSILAKHMHTPYILY